MAGKQPETKLTACCSNARPAFDCSLSRSPSTVAEYSLYLHHEIVAIRAPTRLALPFPDRIVQVQALA